MKLSLLMFGGALCADAAVLNNRANYAVKGKAEGFATGVTGGGKAACEVPSDKDQLATWLTDNVARCIVIDKEFNFKGSQGKPITTTGCRPDSNKCPGKGQDAINLNNWCQPKTAGAGVKSIEVTYDKAGLSGINVGSNKSIIGVGNKGVIRGRGLRIAKSKNVIIQNIHFTDINPQYIWGGDAVATDAGSDLLWVGT
jgi:pectin lyase